MDVLLELGWALSSSVSSRRPSSTTTTSKEQQKSDPPSQHKGAQQQCKMRSGLSSPSGANACHSFSSFTTILRTWPGMGLGCSPRLPLLPPQLLAGGRAWMDVRSSYRLWWGTQLRPGRILPSMPREQANIVVAVEGGLGPHSGETMFGEINIKKTACLEEDKAY